MTFASRLVHPRCAQTLHDRSLRGNLCNLAMHVSLVKYSRTRVVDCPVGGRKIATLLPRLISERGPMNPTEVAPRESSKDKFSRGMSPDCVLRFIELKVPQSHSLRAPVVSRTITMLQHFSSASFVPNASDIQEAHASPKNHQDINSPVEKGTRKKPHRGKAFCCKPFRLRLFDANFN